MGPFISNLVGLGSNLSPKHHHHHSLGLGSNLSPSSRPTWASPRHPFPHHPLYRLGNTFGRSLLLPVGWKRLLNGGGREALHGPEARDAGEDGGDDDGEDGGSLSSWLEGGVNGWILSMVGRGVGRCRRSGRWRTWDPGLRHAWRRADGTANMVRQSLAGLGWGGRPRSLMDRVMTTGVVWEDTKERRCNLCLQRRRRRCAGGARWTSIHHRKRGA